MPLPRKEYFPVHEVADRWKVKESDIEYYAVNRQLFLSVHLNREFVEQGRFFRNQCGTYYRVPYGRNIYTGLKTVMSEDVYKIFKNTGSDLSGFRPSKGFEYARIMDKNGETGQIFVKPNEIVISRAERDRFEKIHGITVLNKLQKKTRGAFFQENDFRVVYIGDTEWALSPTQAIVVKQLYEAAQTPDPWMNGKMLLHKAEAESFRMRDIFKSLKAWKDLVISDGRGYYKLNIQDVMAETVAA